MLFSITYYKDTPSILKLIAAAILTSCIVFDFWGWIEKKFWKVRHVYLADCVSSFLIAPISFAILWNFVWNTLVVHMNLDLTQSCYFALGGAVYIMLITFSYSIVLNTVHTEAYKLSIPKPRLTLKDIVKCYFVWGLLLRQPDFGAQLTSVLRSGPSAQRILLAQALLGEISLIAAGLFCLWAQQDKILTYLTPIALGLWAANSLLVKKIMIPNAHLLFKSSLLATSRFQVTNGMGCDAPLYESYESVPCIVYATHWSCNCSNRRPPTLGWKIRD